MVSSYMIDSTINSISKESSATIIDRNNNHMYQNQGGNNNHLRHNRSTEGDNHSDFQKIVEVQKNDGISQNKKNRWDETALKTYSHENFNKIVQEEETHQIFKSQNKYKKETAIETLSHGEFENFVRMEDINRVREGNINLSQELAIKRYIPGEEVTSETNLKPCAESAFESLTHEDFEKLVKTEAQRNDEDTASIRYEGENTNNNSHDKHEEFDIFRQEVSAHHANNWHRNPVDTTSRDALPEVLVASSEKSFSIATASPLPSGYSAEVAIATETTQPLPPHIDMQNSNSLKNPYSNTQVMATYLAFILGMVAVAACFLAVQLIRRRRLSKQKWEVHQYVAKFDIEDIDLRPAITGGWHAQYKNSLARGLDGDFENYSDSDDGYQSSDSGPDDREKTIVFLEQSDLSSPIPSSKRPVPFTMQVGERNFYLEDSTNGADSDNDDIFAPVRTRPF